MHIGIRESETRQILKNEMAKTGLKGGGDGLVLFAGTSFHIHMAALRY